MNEKNNISMKNVKIFDGICILIFIFMIVYMFVLQDGLQKLLMPVFKIINPYRAGSWLIGIGFLLTCIYGKGKEDMRWGILMFVCYLITAVLSVFGLLAWTSNCDYLWYLHLVFPIAGIIIVISKKLKK